MYAFHAKVSISLITSLNSRSCGSGACLNGVILPLCDCTDYLCVDTLDSSDF